jgi:hypothetical protein
MTERTLGTFGVRTAWYDKLHTTAVYLRIRTPNHDIHQANHHNEDLFPTY